MAIYTYGDLKQAIQLWLNRNDLDIPTMGPKNTTPTKSVVDVLIGLAERKIFREFRGPANEFLIDQPLTTTTNLIPVPVDMLELKSLMLNKLPLTYMDPFTFGKKYAPQIANVTYEPADNTFYCMYPFFTREEANFKLIGNIEVKSDGAAVPKYTHIPITIHYYKDLSGMNEDMDTNPVLQTNTDLYLFGALSEAEAYLVNDSRIALWAQKYEEAMAKARDYNHQIDYHAGPLIMGGG